MAGQQFEYGFDSIGNRQWTKTGGDSQGVNMRPADYSVDAANQYSSRDVSGTVDILGVADARSTVTVNGQTAYRKGEYFDQALAFANTSAALYPGITNSATFSGSTDSTNGFIFIPKTPEVFIHDYDGNLTSDGRWNYTWDGENRLIKMESRNTTPTNSWRRLTLAYDSNGRRIRKTVQLANPNGTWGTTVVSNLFVYDGWNLKLELNATNKTTIRAYTWGSDLSGSQEGAGGVGGLLQVVEPGSSKHYFPAYDGNGNIVGLVYGATGAFVASYEYGPFGEPIRVSGTEASANPFRWSTKYTDDESDLVYYGYRYYNPSTGRWPNQDPIGERGGINLYGFVRNNPIDTVDLFGLSDEKGAERLMKLCKPKPECREDEKVSIWICKRKLGGRSGPFPIIGPLSHSFVACDDPKTTPPDQIRAYGKQPRPLEQDGSKFGGPGYIDEEQYGNEPGNFDNCKEKKVCPQERDRKCSGTRSSETPYFLFSPWHNCHAWANGRCN